MPAKRILKILYVILVLPVLLLVGLFAFNLTTLFGTEPNPIANSSTPPSPEPAAVSTESWKYLNDMDKITGKASRFASLRSTNSIDNGFPYGRQKLLLTVRHQASDGLSVLVSLNKGQIICDISKGCKIKVRFDSDPAMTFSGTVPDDYSSDTLFLTPAKTFVSRLRKSQSLVIQLTFYQRGEQRYEFTTAGLTWEG